MFNIVGIKLMPLMLIFLVDWDQMQTCKACVTHVVVEMSYQKAVPGIWDVFTKQDPS